MAIAMLVFLRAKAQRNRLQFRPTTEAMNFPVRGTEKFSPTRHMIPVGVDQLQGHDKDRSIHMRHDQQHIGKRIEKLERARILLLKQLINSSFTLRQKLRQNEDIGLLYLYLSRPLLPN